MRDFYDIRTLLSIYEEEIDENTLKKAFEATCKKRGTEHLKAEGPKIIAALESDSHPQNLWNAYQRKYPYAADIRYADIMACTKRLFQKAY